MSTNNFTQDQFLKIEWLVADVTTVGSPDRAGRDINFGGDFGCFSPIQVVFVVGEPLCDTETP